MANSHPPIANDWIEGRKFYLLTRMSRDWSPILNEVVFSAASGGLSALTRVVANPSTDASQTSAHAPR